MTEKKELWMEYPRGGSEKIRINLYDTETLVDILSAWGTKAPVWDGDLDISDCGLEQLPDLSRIEVAGIFNVSRNYIKTMKGSPYRVGGDYLANGTKLGEAIDGIQDARVFMDGFPAKGIGGDLQIILTNIDNQYGSLPEERAGDLVVIKELQEHTGGKIWTSAILWEERNRVDQELGNVDWNDPQRVKLIEEQRALGDFIGKMIRKPPAAEAREVQAIKNIRDENKKYCEKRYPNTQKPVAEKSPAQQAICSAVHEWANQKIEDIQEELNKNYDNRMGSKRGLSRKATEALEIQRRVLLVKMFILSEVIKINQSEQRVKADAESVALWKRAKHSFGLKDKQMHGEGLSLKGLEGRADVLWGRAQTAFGLNEQGVAMLKTKKAREHA